MIPKYRGALATRSVGIAGAILAAMLAFGTAADEASVPKLKFGDFYQMPFGPRGLEVSQRLADLNGHAVRMRGYMVHQANPLPGVFILSPIPVELGEADESLSDDLPPNVVFVHFDERSVPYCPGVVQLTGTLSVGARNEADGHVSQVQLNVDPGQLPPSPPTYQP